MTNKIKRPQVKTVNTKLRVALYIRVSTQEQVDNSSIETQKEKLEAYCKAKDWVVYDTYIDPGYSGSNLNRPDLQRLLGDLKHIDAVMVYKLDRLSRSQKDTLELIEDYFLKNNVDFVSVTETLDTSTPFGKAMIGILSVFAQLEREMIAERMRDGLIDRAKKGYWVAGGNYEPAGFGVRHDGDLYEKEDEVKHIQAAYNYYEQLHSITKMQARLKEDGFPVWRFRRYNDVLRSRLNIGEVSFAGVYYKGRHKPIISKEQFDRVQALLERHKGKNWGKVKESLLSGLMTCGGCRESFVTYKTGITKRNKKSYRYYICRAKRFPSEYTHKCTNINWNATKLDSLIADEISNLLINKKTQPTKSKHIEYDKLIKNVDAKMKRILSLYAEGRVPVALLNDQMEELQTERLYLKKREELQEEKSSIVITEEDLKQFSIDLNAGDFPTRQAIVQKFIKEIIIHGDDIEIIWNF
ncbi:recombinase family protein [Neobacillus notoginsengisoli]|uniref:Recombinase family protein n=1 Tax=Neobacillus notoginsengisoli TaxID=1578198 RepID=A0A417YRE4_9BACI|nr:recombinase family protein [Neobacillus notoginsengisoli]RHW37287.1 recombinase family protein [Neobacillus notoginsengisoli]